VVLSCIMADRNRIRALSSGSNTDGTSTASSAGADEAVNCEVSGTPDDYPDYVSDDTAGKSGWFAPALAIAALIGWSALYLLSIQTEFAAFAASAPADWARWIMEWSIPALLIGVVWLIAMRHSRAEARRFADSAALLSRESAELEQRLTVINRELSLAREFLASQTRDLDAMGRVAVERISTHASELQSLIHNNSSQVEAIAAASETALSNMNRLRDDMPVIANSSRDVANQIGNAGNTAHEQAERLVAAFDRLAASGDASEQQIAALAERTEQSLAGFAARIAEVEGLLSDRFAELQGSTQAYRDEIATAEQEAIANLGQQIARLGQELTKRMETVEQLDANARKAQEQQIANLFAEAARFDDALAQRAQRFAEQIEQRQRAFETNEAQASEVLAQRLADLDDALSQRREAQIADTERLVAHGRDIAAQLDQLCSLLAQINHQTETTHTTLTAGLGTFGEQLEDKQTAIEQTKTQMQQLTEAGIRVLEIIQSGTRTTREDLASSIITAHSELSAVEQRANEVNGLMLRASEQGQQLDSYLTKTREEVAATDTAIAELRAILADGSEDALARLQGLRAGFARLAEETSTLATDSQDQLRMALGAIEQSITAAFDTLSQGAQEKVLATADKLGSGAVEALERSLRNETAAAIGKLEQAASHASGVGREATTQLRDQLALVNELTGNLEQRIARAREQAREQVNNDFARRMALITDSLNSAAIDISAALSTEVSDTAWEAYLKGDRGIFTRRAVRLITAGGAKQIAELYQRDDTFRADVSRYIHDFEAMLRSMLSTRDGHVVTVTMLGSDMGKLYVVLAQAIQRFRN
jgi:uncharacterized phage infection (PIP) family protein YhgE